MSERHLPLPPALERLSVFIDSHTECLAESGSELRSIALYATKHIFDWALETEKPSKPHLGKLLATLTQTAPPQTRSQTRRTLKRKRSPSPMQKPPKKVDTRETPLPFLFIESMNMDQIWQQLDLRAARMCENLQLLLGEDEDTGGKANLSGESDNDNDEEGEEEEGEEKEAEEMDTDGDKSIREELSDAEDEGSSTAEGVVDLRDEASEDEDDGPPNSRLHITRDPRLRPSESYTGAQGHSNLDDVFFNLAAFNAETSEVEVKEVYKRKLKFSEDEDFSEESEVDLFALVDDPTAESVDDGLELFYNDFFKPPPQVQNRSIRPSKVRFHEQVAVKRIKAVGRGMPVSFMDDEDSDEEEGDSSSDDNSWENLSFPGTVSREATQGSTSVHGKSYPGVVTEANECYR